MTASVLIADDNPADVELIMLAFAENGLEVEFAIASTGVEAMELLEHARPTLVLLDIKMPLADGFQVLEHLARRDRLRGLHVIMMSSSTAPSDIQRARVLGAADYWPKPARFDEAVQFIGGLRRHLANKPA